MGNYLLLNKSTELSDLSKKLGFSKTFFLGEEIIVVKGKNKKELLREIEKNKGKIIIYKPHSEEMLRFSLEKTKVNIIYGFEDINPKDSLHYVRGGLDQVTCKIAAQNDKKIGFSFSEILNSKDRGRLMARMRLNLKLCKKYKVDVIFSNFSVSKMEMRSKKDLDVFRRVIEKK